MKSVTCLISAFLVCAVFGGTAVATPWFTENFDYGDPGTGTPDRNAFIAVWSVTDGNWAGDIQSNPPNWLGDPFAWQQKKGYSDVRANRSLVPAIQAGDPSKNAVNATAANPLIVKYQMQLGGAAATQDDKVVCWLEMIGREITDGDLNSEFAAPVKNPGSYNTHLGVCDQTSHTCTDGFGKMIGKGCARNYDCDTPMWLDFLPSTTGTCPVLGHTLPVPRPSLAFGAYGGTNGLWPKPEPGDNCSSWGSNAVVHMVTFDGDHWSRLIPTDPFGASGDTIETSRNTTNITLTIRENDYDITVEQPVTCNYPNKCDSVATCITGVVGACVNNVCTANGNACSTDADCNFCSDNITQTCAADADCRTYTCEAGLVGNACTKNADCTDYTPGLVCNGGSTDGASCSGTAGALSDTCGPQTTTKSHIPRKYKGPFQSIAIGPGRVYDGNSSLARGSDFAAYIDSIEFSGGEFVTAGTGACCLPDGSCVQAMESACVQIEGAFYNGDNTSCEAARCNAGACCTDQGCVGEKTQTECDALNGQFQGRGTTCDGTTCLGACCGGQGSCSETFANTCSGDFRGPNSTCANSTPCCPSPYPDWDGDNDVDGEDFAFLQRCLVNAAGTQLIEPGCACVDHNHDGLINDVDIYSFIECQTGPGITMGTVPANCAP